MAKIIHQRVDDPSEADSYERASAFLSEWIEDSLVVPTASDDVHQNHTMRRFSLPEIGLTSRPLRRRATLSNPSGCTIDSCSSDEAIDSLVNSLRATLLTYQNPSSHSGFTSDTTSPSSTTTVLQKEGERLGVPFLPFEGSPNVARPIFHPSQDRVTAVAARSARESRHVPCITLRRRSSEGGKDEVKSNDSVYKPSSAHMMNEQGPMRNQDSSRSKQEDKSATKPPRKSQNHRRHTIDCDRSFTSSNEGCAETTEFDNEDVLHSSLGSLWDQRRSSSRFTDHGPTNINCVRKREDPPTMVVSLPWNGGLYTGQVNTLVQPHGSGALRQSSGNFVKGVWNNGNLTNSLQSSKSSLATSSVLKKKIVDKGAGIYHDDPAASGMGDVNPSDRDEEKESSKTSKSSYKKSVAVQGEPFVATYKPKASVKTSVPRPLDRLCELDGPPDFDLGDKSPTTKYQIIESDPNKALRNIAQLRVHDFAWILRSSREWTYAIVADFPGQGDDKCIRFVIDKMGNTKTLKKKYWAKCIRLVVGLY